MDRLLASIGASIIDPMPDATNPERAAKPRRRWFQFGLRTLLFTVLVASVGFGWLARELQVARSRRAAVVELDRIQVYVYQYEPTTLGRSFRKWPALDRFVRANLGDDLLSSPSAVNATHVRGDQLSYLIERLKLFPQLRLVHVGFLSDDDRAKLEREVPGVELRATPYF